ncbi:hypothetical protein EV189_0035 [Motilibacter rhizosphaerae]|uniref:Excreted virulence factor EspC (Type VII ESX diderm) n=1 Tax=Motilibacter rhizosphaerae TaxID=598652 RepID=A0A4Q7NUC7_9ACTN|nr:hypothetical protein [Motilibacter rhizosphaerae]RZS90806.1 hypothetical protein EV189_0035 [Motilibacter rhizosphaerae]
MGNSFRIDPGAADAAADRFGEAASALRAVDVAGPFAPVEGALPGSATSVATVWTSTRMGATVQVLAERVKGVADGTHATVANYRNSDGAGAGRFGRLAR